MNVLVLCQRSGGTYSFDREIIKSIERDIDYLINLNGLHKKDKIIIDYLTDGLGHTQDQMTFNMIFDFKDKNTIDFVEQHLKYYNFIVIGGCPYTVFNNNNIELLSHILKQNGQIIIHASQKKNFNIWIEKVINEFKIFFNVIEKEPKFIMEKKPSERAESKINAIVIDSDDEKGGYEFGKVNSTDKKIKHLFNEIETGGGGNCLFTSLAYAYAYADNSDSDNSDSDNIFDINLIQKEAKKIRQKICKYNPPDLVHFVSVGQGEKSMFHKTTYGTVIEIEKAARLYKRPIIVYKEGRKNGLASKDLCLGARYIKQIKDSKMFKGVTKYFIEPFKSVLPNMYCIFLPEKDTDNEPIIIYNIDDVHYRVLIEKTSRKSRKIRKSSRKSVRKTRKSSRKSRKTRKSSRKSRKIRKSSRKSRKINKPRKSRKIRKSSRKSRKINKPRKSRKS
jgi:hypothetical protein